MTARSGTRDRILAAAEDLVLSDGVARLTLDAAAARAGVSKGGVLYHFPSRTALISAMVQRLADAFDAELRGWQAQHPGPGAAIRAYLAESFCEPGHAESEQVQRSERLGAAILPAMVEEPELLRPLREAFARWQQEIVSEAADPARATVIRLALDGLWLCDLFGFTQIEPALRDAVRVELERMLP